MKEIIGINGDVFLVKTTFKDFTGYVLGRLYVEGISHMVGKHYIYKATCSCGNETFVNKRELKCGDTQSCGCLYKESVALTSAKFSEKYKTHGMAGTTEYKAWKRIKSRVCNENSKEYQVYSVLGMSDAWKTDFMSFYADIGPVPDSRPRWSVGRIDNSKGYFQGNVRWERDEQQSKNKGRYKNNSSGTTGVYCQKINGEPYSWVASWYSVDKKQCSKYYTIAKYGDELAKLLAEEKRDIEFRKLLTQDIGYSENHGK